MRLRTAGNKLKIEHSIIDGVKALLTRLLEQNPETIRSVVPGVIKPVRDARGEIKLRITVPTANGGARQELFISTTLTQEELEKAFEKARR